MDDTLNILAYGGIVVLVFLSILFEIKEGRIGRIHTTQNSGYEYYTESGEMLRIRHVFGSLYKAYVFNYCPIATKKDRMGVYFPVHARSASEAEYLIDGIYRRGG
jgi:hypothetical protein